MFYKNIWKCKAIPSKLLLCLLPQFLIDTAPRRPNVTSGSVPWLVGASAPAGWFRGRRVPSPFVPGALWFLRSSTHGLAETAEADNAGDAGKIADLGSRGFGGSRLL